MAAFTLPPMFDQVHLDTYYALIRLASDPAAAKARIDAIMEAHARLDEQTRQHAEMIKRHDASRSALQVAMDEHAKKLQAATDEHEASFAGREKKFLADLAARARGVDERQAALENRERELVAREGEAQRAREIAAAVRATFEAKIAAINAAVSG
jgi:hypothetical protein